MKLALSFFVALCCLQVSRQSEKGRSDVYCGAECLFVIAGGLELPGNSFADIKRDLGTPSKQGYSLEAIEKVASGKGLFVEKYSLSILSQKKELPSKCFAILHKKENHFQILKGLGPGYADILDTQMGMMRIPKPQFLRDYSESVLIIAKSKPIWKHYTLPYWTLGGILAMLLFTLSWKFVWKRPI